VVICRGNYLDGEEDEGTMIWNATATGAGETMLGDVEKLNGDEHAAAVPLRETGTEIEVLPHVHGHDHGHCQWRVSE
jgi:ADP-dependent phosphofructokinase/glucokinase